MRAIGEEHLFTPIVSWRLLLNKLRVSFDLFIPLYPNSNVICLLVCEYFAILYWFPKQFNNELLVKVTTAFHYYYVKQVGLRARWIRHDVVQWRYISELTACAVRNAILCNLL